MYVHIYIVYGISFIDSRIYGYILLLWVSYGSLNFFANTWIREEDDEYYTSDIWCNISWQLKQFGNEKSLVLKQSSTEMKMKCVYILFSYIKINYDSFMYLYIDEYFSRIIMTYFWLNFNNFISLAIINKGK